MIHLAQYPTPEGREGGGGAEIKPMWSDSLPASNDFKLKQFLRQRWDLWLEEPFGDD